MATIGENIRMLRKIRKMTQKELGELCGIDEANIRKYELNNQIPRVETIKKIADALDVSTFTLMDDVLPPDEPTSLPLKENIRKIRILRGLKQKQLAQKSGLSPNSISEYESGYRTPSIDALEKLSKALTVPPCMLLACENDIPIDLSVIPTKDLLAEIERRCS